MNSQRKIEIDNCDLVSVTAAIVADDIKMV